MSALLDAQDLLARVRDFAEILAMTVRENPDDEGRAISTVCATMLAELAQANTLLEDVKAGLGAE